MTIEGLPLTDIIIVHNLSKPKMMPFNFLFFVKPNIFSFKYSDSGKMLLSFAKWLYFVIPFTVLTYVAHAQFLTSSYHHVVSTTWPDLEEVKTVEKNFTLKSFLTWSHVFQWLLLICPFSQFWEMQCLSLFGTRQFSLNMTFLCSPLISDCVGVDPLSTPTGLLSTSYRNFTLKFHK